MRESILAGPVADRFAQHIDQTPTCWLWTGFRDKLGYGRFRVSPNRKRYAHRLAYELWVRPIPDGLEIDHLCRNPPCVRPDHLEAVTHRENMRRGISPAAHALRFNECKHGHPLTPENTYTPLGDPTRRKCRTCNYRRLAESDARLGRNNGHHLRP